MTPEQENENRFANRRKIAFMAKYGLLGILVTILYKVWTTTPAEFSNYESVLNTIIMFFTGIIGLYIGAASYEQSNLDRLNATKPTQQ
jgi:uncharacterized membrane protein